jgi:hypothetical protein
MTFFYNLHPGTASEKYDPHNEFSHAQIPEIKELLATAAFAM